MDMLTKRQREAVESGADTTLVIAGPGTGKTHIIASRVEFLVKRENIEPENILCLTYTNAGAITMKKRIVSFIGNRGRDMTVSTFHSFASSLLADYPDVFGYRGDAHSANKIDQALIIKDVIDKLYQKGELKKLTTATDPYFYKSSILKNINTLKSEGISPDKYIKMVEKWQEEFDNMPDEEKLASRGPTKGQVKSDHKKTQERIYRNEEFALVYKYYEEELNKKNIYDYDDMINRAIEGLEKNPDILKQIQGQYKSVLVDEYQDTNGSQNKLLFKLLEHKNYNCFVVGDDDQAINRFQGATIENFTDFLDKFPETNIVALEDNFRSPQTIIDSALRLIDENETRINKKVEKLPTKKLVAQGTTAGNQEYTIQKCKTDAEEKAFITEKIIELNKNGTPYSEIAVLTRDNKAQTTIANTLYAHNIPYITSSNQNSLEHPAIISFLKMLKCCQSPTNGEWLASFLRHPATPIATEDTITVLSRRSKNRTSLYDEFKNSIKDLQDKEEAKKTFEIIKEMYEKQESTSAVTWICMVLEKTGFLTWVLSQGNKIEILKNILAVCDEAQRMQDIRPRITVSELLQHFESFYELKVELEPSSKIDVYDDAINILTAHQSKGREFDYVFVVNNTQGVWNKTKKRGSMLALHPSIVKIDTDKEDDRRLFFVALTRAKKGLFISYAEIHTENTNRPEEKMSSEFIDTLIDTVSQEDYVPKNIQEFIEKTIITPPPSEHTQDTKKVIQQIIQDPSLSLSATSVNNFLTCPNMFLYDSVLRVPSSSSNNIATVYGSAVHNALEKYFQVKPQNRSMAFMLESIKEYVENNSPLTEADNNIIVERAEEAMDKYYKKLEKEEKPMSVEKKISVNYEGIPLTGKVDKISYTKDGKLRIVDYKTSKKAPSTNQILGKTKGTEGEVLGLYNQLMFYKLLVSLDNELKDKNVTEFILDYVDVSKEIDIPIDVEDYENFLKTIKDVWSVIQDLSFLESTEQFPFCQECQYCTTI